VPIDLVRLVQLVPQNFQLTQDILTTQFDVLSSSMVSAKNASYIHVNIIFRRKIMYHMANTFLPTISLLVIVEFTLFFDSSNEGMSVTLSLTVMLVMYTLYQSISQTIPKTAYMKLVDYWLIFCLLVPFVIFIVESIWYLDQAKKKKQKGQKDNKWVQKAVYHNAFQQKLIQKVLPSLTITFTFGFFALATYNYF